LRLLNVDVRVAGSNWRGMIGGLQGWEHGRLITLTGTPIIIPLLTAKFSAGLAI